MKKTYIAAINGAKNDIFTELTEDNNNNNKNITITYLKIYSASAAAACAYYYNIPTYN